MKFASKVFVSLAFLTASAAFATDDLVLTDAKYPAAFSKYVCNELTGPGVSTPESASFVKFDRLVGDKGLNFFLITANYGANNECRYSAILQRDRATLKATVIESKVVAKVAGTDCEPAKEGLDTVLTNIPYEATPQGHRFVSLGLDLPEAKDLCGAEAANIKLVFERVKQ